MVGATEPVLHSVAARAYIPRNDPEGNHIFFGCSGLGQDETADQFTSPWGIGGMGPGVCPAGVLSQILVPCRLAVPVGPCGTS